MHPHGPTFSHNPTAQTAAAAEQFALRAGQSASAGNRIATAFQVVLACTLGVTAAVHAYRAVFPAARREEHHKGR